MRESGNLDQGGGCRDGDKVVLAGLGACYMRESEQHKMVLKSSLTVGRWCPRDGIPREKIRSVMRWGR